MAAVLKKKAQAQPINNHKSVGTTIQHKFLTARREMSSALIERDDELDLAMIGLLAGEHPLLVGPPGTGKSFTLDALADWIQVPRFSYLLTKFTDPMELFGPVDIQALKAGESRRIVDAMMPQAVFCFLDEIFKGSSAILNTLLKVINERTFKYGKQELSCPLRLCVAASNEWPGEDGGKELGALFDRFLLRKWVRPIQSMANRRRLWWTKDHKPKLSSKLSLAELDQANAEVRDTTWTPEAMNAFEQIVSELAKEGIMPGDRRQYKSVKACQALAYLSGDATVQVQHLDVLQHCFWEDPHEQPAKAAKVVCRIANPVGVKVNEALAAADEIMAKVAPQDLGQNQAATVKLQELERGLAALQATDRSRIDKARNYIREQIKSLLRAINSNVAPLDIEEV